MNTHNPNPNATIATIKFNTINTLPKPPLIASSAIKKIIPVANKAYANSIPLLYKNNLKNLSFFIVLSLSTVSYFQSFIPLPSNILSRYFKILPILVSLYFASPKNILYALCLPGVNFKNASFNSSSS